MTSWAISSYFCILLYIYAAILKGNELENCMARPILQACFKVRSMYLASTIYKLVMTVNIRLYK